MAATGRQTAAPDLAAGLREAGLVRLAPAATGDGVAAAGVLARSLNAIDIPYQIGVETGEVTRGTEADVTLALDRERPDVDETLGGDQPASAVAFEVARSLDDQSANAVVAAAGVLAAGTEPTGQLAEVIADAGIERRPGVAVPTDDPVDGLAHSTRLYAPFSGDPEAVRNALADATAEPQDDEGRRRLASLVALRTVDAEDASARAAESIADALRPHAGGPLATLEGYGDVLDAAVREDPGTAVALALGHDAREDALAAWRSHASSAHEALRAVSIQRHSGLVVAESEGPIETVARLLRDYRSPEPLALVAGDGRVALAATENQAAAAVLETATESFDLSGRVTGDADLAVQPYPGDVDRLVAAIREVSRDA
ncbi:recombinase RecJ [Halorhabdus amylolytica]|uniref:recombinase RecJ n=1 Tax=Halorhabdus amylolytica TaxID=2559573 RepID=UPI0010AAC3DE|nr:recombinase RecJ [Halorhabdus amylolytica]